VCWLATPKVAGSTPSHALSGNNLGQVVQTHVPLSPSRVYGPFTFYPRNNKNEYNRIWHEVLQESARNWTGTSRKRNNDKVKSKNTRKRIKAIAEHYKSAKVVMFYKHKYNFPQKMHHQLFFLEKKLWKNKQVLQARYLCFHPTNSIKTYKENVLGHKCKMTISQNISYRRVLIIYLESLLITIISILYFSSTALA